MRKKTGFLWKLYFLIYLLMIGLNTIYLFASQSPMNLYYHLTMAYSPYFVIPYSLNVLSILLNAFSLIPFYLYLYRIYFLSPQFWKLLLVSRLTLDITGRSYELKLLKSLFYHDTNIALMMLGAAILINIPSYYILTRYAFERQLVFWD